MGRSTSCRCTRTPWREATGKIKYMCYIARARAQILPVHPNYDQSYYTNLIREEAAFSVPRAHYADVPKPILIGEFSSAKCQQQLPTGWHNFQHTISQEERAGNMLLVLYCASLLLVELC